MAQAATGPGGAPGGGAAPVRRPLAPSPRAVVVLVVTVGLPVVVLVTLALAGAAPTGGGLGDPGPLARWGRPVLSVWRDVVAAVTLGLLVLAVLTLQTRENAGDDVLDPDRLRVVRLAARTAAAWCAVLAALLVLSWSTVRGRAAGATGFADGLGVFLLGSELGRVQVGGVVLTLVVAVGTWRATRLSSVVVLTLVATAALMPVALGGHAASEADHATAVNAVFAHLVGVSVWTGGLAGLLLVRRVLALAPGTFAAMATRYSTIAGAAFVLVAVAGVWRLLVRLDAPADLLSPYGTVVIAKTVLLGVLGGVGALHRRRTLVPLRADPGRSGPFVRLAAGELAVMGIATALGTAVATLPTR